MNKIIAYALLLLICIVSAFSQVLLKKAAKKDHLTFISQYLNFEVIFAYSLFVIVVVVNSLLLKYIPYSVASTISESTPCVFAIISGAVFFSEKISRQKLLGILLIVSGIVIIVL